MSEAIAFDTHRFVKRLTENGFTEAQAEVLADEQVTLLNGNLATKQNIAGVQKEIEVLRQETKQNIAGVQKEIEVLRQETKQDLAGVRKDIEVLRQETKQDLAGVRKDIEVLRQETRADIERVKSDLLKWMFGALVAQGGLIVALIKLV